MTDIALPGTPVDIPLPPDTVAAFGYDGPARFVGLSWSSLGDQLVVSDGVSSGTGQSWAFLGYKRHRAVAPLLAPFDLGSSEEDGPDVLLIDTVANRASVAPVAEARVFLQGQHPPREPMTPEQEAEFHRHLEDLIREHRERPIDHDAISKAMAEQRGRVARLMNWLDMCPVPPQRGQTP